MTQAPEYTVDWIAGRVPAWVDNLIPEFKDKPVRAIEIGVFEGRAARWFLENVLTHPDSSLVLIDPYRYSERVEIVPERTQKAQKLAQSNLAPFSTRVEWHLQRSEDVLPRLLGPFDLIRVDGEHTTKATLLDMVLSWRLLRPGGILIVDDYAKHIHNKQLMAWGHDTPATAADLFLELVPTAHVSWKFDDIGIRKFQ